MGLLKKPLPKEQPPLAGRRPPLQTNVNSYFANYLLKGEKEYARQADTIADREILNAIGECNELVGKWKDKLIELYACINNQLSFLLHEIPEEKKSIRYSLGKTGGGQTSSGRRAE